MFNKASHFSCHVVYYVRMTENHCIRDMLKIRLLLKTQGTTIDVLADSNMQIGFHREWQPWIIVSILVFCNADGYIIRSENWTCTSTPTLPPLPPHPDILMIWKHSQIFSRRSQIFHDDAAVLKCDVFKKINKSKFHIHISVWVSTIHAMLMCSLVSNI